MQCSGRECTTSLCSSDTPKTKTIIILKVGYRRSGEGGNEDYILSKNASILKDNERLWKSSRLKEAKEPELLTLTEVL